MFQWQNREQEAARASGIYAGWVRTPNLILVLPHTWRVTLAKAVLTLCSQLSYRERRGLGFQSVFLSGSVKLCMRVESWGQKEAPTRAALVSPVLLLAMRRFSLHKGFAHKGSQKTTPLKDGCLQALLALTLHDSGQRQERRMDAGKDASIRKRSSCYK